MAGAESVKSKDGVSSSSKNRGLKDLIDDLDAFDFDTGAMKVNVVKI